VRQAKEYIAAGDIFQMVLSQRLSCQAQASPFAIYRALRRLNPSPYMVFLRFPGGLAAPPLHVVAASPEMHVRLEGRTAELRPIAGTRPRGLSDEEDAELAAELLADEKERAEHVMLVDLGRNDLGRVCDYGSVHLDEVMTIERYSHVMHIVSDVRAGCATAATPSTCYARPSRPALSRERPRCARWRSSRNWNGRGAGFTPGLSAMSASTARWTRASPSAPS